MERRRNSSITICFALLIAVMLIAGASLVTGSLVDRTFTATGGLITYAGLFGDEPKKESATDILTVYSGEKVAFQQYTNGSLPVVVTGPYTKAGEKYSGMPFKKETLGSGAVWDSAGKSREGYFNVEDANGEGGWFEMIKHSFTVELAENRERVREGTSFRLCLQGNEKEAGVLKLTIRDDDGYSLTNAHGTDIYEILVTYDTTGFVGFRNVPVEGIRVTEQQELEFDTTTLTMDAGMYLIALEDYATEAASTERIAVEERYLTVACADEVVMGREIVVILTSSFYRDVATVTLGGAHDVSAVFTVTLDNEGKKKLKILTSELDYGTHRITAEVEELQATTYVTITRAAVGVHVPEHAMVGDLVPVVGDATSGGNAVFVIDGRYAGEARIRDELFEWEWDTHGAPIGCLEIEVFILDERAAFEIGDDVPATWREKSGVDATVSIFLHNPAFSMHVPESLAEGDDLVVYGSATGTDHVYLMVITAEGEVVFPPGGRAQATPVIGGTWEQPIHDLRSGRYYLLGLHRGKDGITEAIEDGVWLAGGPSKTAPQRLAILEHELTAAGSDDIFAVAALTVSNPQVSLTMPAVIAREEALTVTAETNVRDGERAFISLSSGSDIIIESATRVTNGTVQACINCTELPPATYIVRVDIGGRVSDEIEIQLEERRENVSSVEALPPPAQELQPVPEAAETVAEDARITEERAAEEQALCVSEGPWIAAIALFLALSRRRARKRG
ncbi:MAG TPA: hypothetical protein ENN68_04770 [Methanomicrobia archaeon]|nr:hypothetical protein [Methanomicrobia archaeon]